MLAEKLGSKRGKREALNPPLLFSPFSAAKPAGLEVALQEGVGAGLGGGGGVSVNVEC